MIKLPETSRGWQLWQHFVSGTLSILQYVTAGIAALFVTKQIGWTTFFTVAIITFILNRMSSEISYQTSKKLFEEHRR